MDSTSKRAPESNSKDRSLAEAPFEPVADFPIVALGASAGGLKALESFFRSMPPDAGMAFVLAMHLSPGHESQLGQILQASTSMPVTQVQSPVEVEPDHVYVIAPRSHLTLQGRRLRVSARDHPPASGVIDHLFTSLADERQERAIGIVLSGSGMDGTLGLRAIKERGGILLAQDPEEADYESMPRSVIATGLVDHVLPAADMPALLIELRDQAPRAVLSDGEGPGPQDEEHALRAVLRQLRDQTGHDFTHYKRTALRRHLARRMLLVRDESLAAYAHRLRNDEEEVDALFRALLIRVTRFFRDPEAYRTLERKALPALFEEAEAVGEGDSAVIRVWVPGCATGEEVYSLAILLAEQRDARDSKVQLQLLATDIDEAALSIARRGLYAEGAVSGLGPERLRRFFVHRHDAYQVADSLREMVVFAAHDLTRDPPFARIDLISCRNLLIYFEAESQQRVLQRCAYSLRQGGFLFLGTSESTGRASSLFAAVSSRRGLYRRSLTPGSTASLHFFPIAPALPGAAAAQIAAAARTRLAGTAPGEASADGTAVEPGDPGVEPTNASLILANQEMQSLNEELRSMMEELEVAKEEMQSLNEELTMVNQELQNKIEEHRRVNSDLHVLIDSTHMATLFLDPQLNVVLYTPESTKLFSLLPVDVGRPLEHLAHRLRYDGVMQDARRVLAEGVAVDREVQDADEKWYAMRVLPYTTEAAPAGGVVLTFADITAQKKVEQVSDDRFTLAFHAGPMAASIVTRDEGILVDVNQNFEAITGFRAEEVLGHRAQEFGLLLNGETEALPLDGSQEGFRDAVEAHVRTKSGAMRDLLVSTAAIEFERRPCILSLFYDVTERKRLEREILLVSDREQRRIGVDLHDGLGTHLTGVAMLARSLARTLRTGRAVAADEIEEIARLISEGIEQARTLAQGLNPFLLESRGLSPALSELVANVQAQTGIPCSFEVEGSASALGSDVSMHLYRISQEALTNAARHAHASQISISLSNKNNRGRLTIRDDGVGFPNVEGGESVGNTSGMGLSIMRYRAAMIGGRLHVVGTPGHGTTVTCTFRTDT